MSAPYSRASAFESRIKLDSEKYASDMGEGLSVSTVPRMPRGVEIPMDILSPSAWTGEPPAHDWIVDGCFLRGTVAMLSGDGGLGKSLLMQQLCTAAALGKDWLGLETKPCNTFAFFCEDDPDELHRRQFWINKHYGCQPADLGDRVSYAARVGMENILVEFDRRTDEPKFTALLTQLRDTVINLKAEIIILDTLADVFAGNEIIRNQVRRFVTALRKLAMEARGVVVLTAHPSLTGMNTGTGLSGSTGWNNSVRSRLYLTKPKTEDEEGQGNERYLKTMKNNQGPFGGKIRLTWDKGVFVQGSDHTGPVGVVDRIELDVALMDALRSMVANGTLVAASQDYRFGFCNIVRDMPEFKHFSQNTILTAQNRLTESGKLVRVEIGPPSKRRVYLRPPDLRYPGEHA